MATITVSSLDFGFRYLGSRPGQLVVLCSWAKNLLLYSASLQPGIFASWQKKRDRRLCWPLGQSGDLTYIGF